jgi:hypothetical protein
MSQSDCDTAPGASGGANLVPNSDGSLMLLITQGSKGEDFQPYHDVQSMSTHVPLDREFLKAVQSLVGADR